MSTKYVFEEVEVAPGISLYVDGNSKVSRTNGTYEDPVPNSFSLPHIATCPGATKQCMQSCYVHGLKKLAPEVYDKYMQNEQAIHAILSDPFDSNLGEVTAQNLAEWISENAPGGFRWHVSGDVFSYDYMTWIWRVCNAATDVPFWIYTRSFEVLLSWLSNNEGEIPENLVINLSADAGNWEKAVECHEYVGNRLCYLTQDGTLPELPEGSVIFPDYSLRGRDLEDPTSAPWWQGLAIEQKRMVCPADFFGQSEKHRCGPCDKCLK